VRTFLKQRNRRLQQLFAVENKTILQQLKPSTLCMMFHLTLILYPHHTGVRSQMLYTNGSFEICQERMFVKQRRKDGWSTYLLQKDLNSSFDLAAGELWPTRHDRGYATESFEILQEKIKILQCCTFGLTGWKNSFWLNCANYQQFCNTPCTNSLKILHWKITKRWKLFHHYLMHKSTFELWTRAYNSLQRFSTLERWKVCSNSISLKNFATKQC